MPDGTGVTLAPWGKHKMQIVGRCKQKMPLYLRVRKEERVNSGELAAMNYILSA
jgi:hypothetical protein